MREFDASGARSRRRIRIQKPTINNQADESLWRDVNKFAKLIPSEPEPNLGRVREIKEEIRKGTYLTQEMLDETIARLAVRFMTKE